MKIADTCATVAQLLLGPSPEALALKTAAILSLGTRRDATTWEVGCKGLGFRAPNPLKKPSPTVAELKAFFQTPAHWIFLAGHFTDRLYNEQDTIRVWFEADRVSLQIQGQTAAVLRKDTGDFRLHENCRVVLWGGCSVAGDAERVKTLLTLFGPHTLIAFAGTTGPDLIEAMLGGGWIKQKHFFRLVRGKVNDPAGIRNAWLETAIAGYHDTDLIDRFRVFDPDGQEWKIVNNEITQGRKIVLPG